jgi:hypothetical protein
LMQLSETRINRLSQNNNLRHKRNDLMKNKKS